MTSAKTDVSVVLVHAAWTDGSSWNKVTGELQRKGLKVVAAQIPLTSFTDDVAVLKKVLLRQKGPIVLAGHSYGGAVITAAAAGNADVKALVYIAAIVPDEGETVSDIFRRVPPHPSAPKLEPDADGFLWLTVDGFRNALAARCIGIRNCSYGSNPKAHLREMSRRADEQSGLERKADLVSHRRKGHYAVSRDTALHGSANEVEDRFFARRPSPLGLKT